MEVDTKQTTGFARELAEQTLISERQRSLILMGIFLAIFAVVGAYRLDAWFRHVRLTSSGSSLYVFAGAALFECALGWIIQRQIRLGKGYALYRAYIGATIEIAIPTLTIAMFAHHGSTLRSVTGPVSYTYFIFIILSSLRLDPLKCVYTGSVCALAYGFLWLTHWPQLAAEWALAPGSMRMNFFMRIFFLVIAGLAAAFVSARIRTALLEAMKGSRERGEILRIFGQHLSPSVVNQLLAQQDISELRNVCVMVLDIRNFTTFSEAHSADQIVSYLNTLWSALVRTVIDHGGYVNKFVGDGFLAVFGAPVSSGKDCNNAIAAARQIVVEVRKLEQSGRLPPTRIGLALHAGEVTVGIVGSEDKKEYAVIGDVVNVAFRIEELNKQFGSTILLSAPVHEISGVPDAQNIARIPIRGHVEPVDIFRLA